MRFVIAIAVVACWIAPARADREINTLIGDASWAGRTEPPASADEVTRIRAHLAFVHAMLAGRDVSQLSAAQRQARSASLSDLARYIARGEFPRRTNDGYEGRRPRFIDDRGVHCAVGQLIADSGHEALAQAIDARFEYAHVREMTSHELVAWAGDHGFTVDELAMIQPSYSPVPDPDSVRRMVVESADTIALRCAKAHAPMTDLLIFVTNDTRGATHVRTKSTDPFAQCFVREASKLDRGGHAYDGGPREFSFGIDLDLKTPQQLLEKTLASWKLSCSPFPGAISREATVDVTSTREGLAIKTASIPPNALVDRCVMDAAKRELSLFGAGAWRLHATRRIKLEPRVRLGADELKSLATDEATTCLPNPARKQRSTVTVRARTDDKQFAVTATGSPDFATCMSAALAKRLEQNFRSSYMDGDKRVELFRIDADVNTTVTIELESQESRQRRDEALRRQMENPDRF